MKRKADNDLQKFLTADLAKVSSACPDLMTSLVSPCVFEAESRFVLDCSRAGREKNVFGAEASDETRFFSVRTLKRVTKKFATIYSGFSSISIPFFLFFAARLKSELLRITF